MVTRPVMFAVFIQLHPRPHFAPDTNLCSSWQKVKQVIVANSASTLIAVQLYTGQPTQCQQLGQRLLCCCRRASFLARRPPSSDSRWRRW